MTDKRTQERADESNTVKPPEDWTTGDEPMTGAQRSYLKTLSEEAKVPMEDDLTKAEASRRIDELQAITGRGTRDPLHREESREEIQQGGEPMGRAGNDAPAARRASRSDDRSGRA